MKRIALILVAAVSLMGCEQNQADRAQRIATQKMQGEALSQVGIPAIVNFQEMRNTKMLYELRDQEIKTISYIADLNGKLHKLCDSIGYGLPYGVQYSNPMRVIISGGDGTIPQAEPNGLFMPDSADGTWVMCLNPQTQAVQPVYTEPRVIVSPFELSIN